MFLVKDLIILITQELLECSHWTKHDAVSLALICRALEIPVLSVLWSRQTMLSTLIRVLPPNALACAIHEHSQGLIKGELVCDSNLPTGHVSYWRYGSWMRLLYVDEGTPDGEFVVGRGSKEFTIGNSVFPQLSLSFPTESVCSGLRKLKWVSSHHWLPSIRHFLSSTLAQMTIFTTPSDGPFQTPHLAIPVLPGLYLESSQLAFHPVDDEACGVSASAAVLQCGVFLERLQISAKLSNAAISYGIFPSLETLILGNGVDDK